MKPLKLSQKLSQYHFTGKKRHMEQVRFSYLVVRLCIYLMFHTALNFRLYDRGGVCANPADPWGTHCAFHLLLSDFPTNGSSRITCSDCIGGRLLCHCFVPDFITLPVREAPPRLHCIVNRSLGVTETFGFSIQ